MTEMLFASSNPHKVGEVRAILSPCGIRVVGLDAVDDPPPQPHEDGDTFQANARLKAVYYARHLGRACLADDSGLVVDALGGAPGVHSARYAREEAGGALFDSLDRPQRDALNNQRLLRELRDVPATQRAARFVCAMCLADPAAGDGPRSRSSANGVLIIAETRGVLEGVIATEARGTNGFGYDPLLYLPDARCTSAQLSPDEKNARSHRGKAACAMAHAIHSVLGPIQPESR